LSGYLQAARWFRLAADQNHPEAQYNLAFLYYHGRGAQDYRQAAGWFQQAEYHWTWYLSASSGPQQIAPSLGILTEATRKYDKRC